MGEPKSVLNGETGVRGGVIKRENRCEKVCSRRK